MALLRFVELDVLKPNQLRLVDLVNDVASMCDTFSVTIKVIERDRETESAQMFIEGNDIDLNAVIKKIEECGATVHSIDIIGVGKSPRVI